MTTTTAWYDSHADWYVTHTQEWQPTAADFLSPDLTGQAVLDLACGWGQLSRVLAERGAAVTGVDVAEQLLARARDLEQAEPAGIRYLAGNAAGTRWWDGTPFDGAVCNMALMDIDDLPGAMSAVARVLRPGGWFVFTLFHPCFPGRGDTLSSWPVDGGYGTERRWSTGRDGVRGHVGANHRMVSTYLNAALRAGLEFEEFAERDTDLPQALLVRCRRPR